MRSSLWSPRSGVRLRSTCLSIALVVGVETTGGAQVAPLTVPAFGNLPTREGYVVGADGVRLFYRLVREGQEVIVFLHGGPGMGIDDGGYDLEPLAAKGHTLLLLNERGAGRSEVITEPAKLGIDAYVADVEAVREQFGLRQISLIGLSWGSAVAAEYAAAHPGRVRRMALVSPMSVSRVFSDQRASHLMSMLNEREIARLAEIDSLWDTTPDEGLPSLCRESLLPVLRLYVVKPDSLNRTRGNVCAYSPAALRNMNRAGSAAGTSLGAWDFRPMLATIPIPTLVIEGAESNAPLDDAREWSRALPLGKFLLIRGAGHMNWLDQPRAVISALDEFFRGRWPRAAQRLDAGTRP